ncbi:MAG TPA: nucleoside-diphosphate kinase [Candidatus Saccharibacteria bacterium]|nr:nucleoside-diphosphate kinase [Candidatus Saccharibacteria bacterium]HMR38539.1 nucleoside-diphosphate kinase [Candidatus Saccharibacteria bacterium]
MADTSEKKFCGVEQTLVVFKPDAVQRGIVGEIMQRFERVGLKIVGMKMVSPDKDHYYGHYETIGQVATRRGESVLNIVLDLMMDGPVIAMVLEGVEAAAVVRKIVGPTEPKAADMGTIRGDFSHISFGYADDCNKGIPNLIHASGDSEEAVKEIKHWFKDEELMTYGMLHEKFTR